MEPPPLSAATVALSPTTTTQQNYPDMLESSSPPPPLPRSRIVETGYDDPLPAVPGSKLRLMCSYGGHIMPRPHDKTLCYVGGDTRIVVVDRSSSLRDLCSRLSRTILHGRPFTLKYQLPNEDLDNLITVTADDDLDNMIEEYDRLAAATASSNNPKSPPSRLRVFLFFTKPEATVSMGSLLDESKSETWFVDALNNSGILSRRVSDSAAGDSVVNLDGVPASGSSNSLEAQGGAAESLTLIDSNISNNRVKNVAADVVISSPGSPMLENSSSSSSLSPSMDNLPPIRVRVVDDNGGTSRLQQEKRIGVMEEQFAQITFGGNGVKPDDGYVVSSAMANGMPAIPASNVTMAPAGVVPTSEYMTRVVSDDERSDHGAPVGSRKPPLPLQLVQPKTNAGGGGGGGLSLPSPDSVASDSSSIASTNSFSRAVYYQEQVQPAYVDNNKPQALPNGKSEISDLVYGLQREQQIQDPGYMLPPQLDQNQQLQQQQLDHNQQLQQQQLDQNQQFQQQQQQAFVHSSTHYMHHPAATGQVPVPASYYQVYAQPPQQQQQQLHQIGQNQYPVYVMPVGHTPQYNMTLQTNPNVVPVPQSAYNKDGTPPIYPTKSTSPTMTSNQAFVQIPSNQYQQQQYVNVNLPQFHPQQQTMNVAPSAGGANYGYEYGGPVQEQAYYTTQQQNAAPLHSQYQSMTPAAAAAALSDASKQFPGGDNNVQQQNRTSQPV